VAFDPVSTPLNKSAMSKGLLTFYPQCKPPPLDPVVPEFMADLLPCLLIEGALNSVALAAIDRGHVASEMFVTFAGVGRAQLV
jgi:hypothetical protein